MENQNQKSVWKQEIHVGFGIPFKKIASGIFIVLGILVILVMVFQIVENVRGRRAFEKWTAQHKDVALDLKHYIPPTIPDEKNLAMIGIFKTVAEVYSKGSQKNTNAVNELTKFDNEYDGVFQILRQNEKKGSKTSVSILDTNYVDLKNIAGALRKENYKDCSSIANDAECVLKAMSAITPYLDTIITESKQREFFRFPIDYETTDPAQILLPHLSYLKKISQIIQIRSVCYMELNKRDAAFEDVRFGLRLADSLKEEPFLISLLVRASMLNIFLQNIR